MDTMAWSVHRAGPGTTGVAAAAARAGSSGGGPIGRSSDAKSRELFLKRRRLALGTDRFCCPLHQQLKTVIAFAADIFEDRHSKQLLGCKGYYKITSRESQREGQDVSGRKNLSPSRDARSVVPG